MALNNNKETAPLVISGFGMVSSIGITADQTCASLNAGITRKIIMPELYFCHAADPEFEDGTALLAASISWLDARNDASDPAEWLSMIAEKAFSDLMDNSAYTDEQFSNTGLFISLPPMLNQSAGMKDEFIYRFHNLIENDIFPCEEYSFEGHNGVISLIEKAWLEIDKGTITRAIVGGVESCLFPEWLEKLDDDYRIKSRRNIDGYTPGEIAAFIIIEKDSNKRDKNKPAFLIDGLASSNSAGGLRKVVSDLLVENGEHPVIVCDLNGESKRMNDWGTVRTALGERLGSPVILEHPADTLGDMGAASGAALTIIAMYYLRKKNRERHSALILTSSDHGERRAIRLIKTGVTDLKQS
jgi:3-oxoacyl-[acyl-carrier-protein] synthase I